tara:strand:+ start:606 stop:842 length:237 start_codon:yes stop_codon:yes gene_type:complete
MAWERKDVGSELVFDGNKQEKKLIELSDTEKDALIKVWEANEIVQKNEIEKFTTDKESGKKKLKDLGLTDDEIKAMVR